MNRILASLILCLAVSIPSFGAEHVVTRSVKTVAHVSCKAAKDAAHASVAAVKFLV